MVSLRHARCSKSKRSQNIQHEKILQHVGINLDPTCNGSATKKKLTHKSYVIRPQCLLHGGERERERFHYLKNRRLQCEMKNHPRAPKNHLINRFEKAINLFPFSIPVDVGKSNTTSNMKKFSFP